MLGHMSGHIRPEMEDSRGKVVTYETGVQEHRERIVAAITSHDALSRRGLWGMLIFIMVSVMALPFRGVDLFADLPESFREILGTPPPPELIHVVLAISTISSIIIILGRAIEGGNPGCSWKRISSNICFRSAFYLLYATANALAENFLIVFTAGIIVLALEHFATWHYAVVTIEKEKEQLAQIR